MAEFFIPRYDLSAEELNQSEQQVIESLGGIVTEGAGVVAVIVGHDHPTSNFGRTYEQMTFEKKEGYDFAKAMRPHETRSTFLYTVDTDAGAIAHVKRIVTPYSEEVVESTGLTGLEMIDDRLTATEAEEAATLGEILEKSNISDLQACMNIATNESTGRAPLTREKPHGLFSYKSVFGIGRDRGAEAVLAYMNKAALRSLGRLGVEYGLLGNKEYHLPKLDGGYDDNYTALHIPGSDHNIAAFEEGDPSKPLTKLVAGVHIPRIEL